MKIKRENAPDFVIGKRVTFGAIVGGLVSFATWFWNLTHPETQIPSEQAVGLTTVITGIGQLVIVNRYGITSHE